MNVQKVNQKRMPNGFWTEETILNALRLLIENLGYFPSQNELMKMKKHSLLSGIAQHNGLNYFREKTGHELLCKLPGYWKKETIIIELKQIIEMIGHFPTQGEIKEREKGDLLGAIHKHGNLAYFKDKLGFNLSLQEKYKSELSSYINKRGKKSEQLIKEIITEWSNIHGKPSPDFNVKLAQGNVIEFVCDFDKKIGIDVTNTKASRNSAINTIRNKWKHKNYILYLDELWIVVFTDVLNSEDYDKLNMKSPNDVKIFSIEGFLEELDYSIEHCDMDLMEKLQICNFHNKEELLRTNKYRISQ